MGPEFVLLMREIVTAPENDDRLKVVVFENAVDGFCLNHSDFLAKFLRRPGRSESEGHETHENQSRVSLVAASAIPTHHRR
jgi:hypothetical protein